MYPTGRARQVTRTRLSVSGDDAGRQPGAKGAMAQPQRLRISGRRFSSSVAETRANEEGAAVAHRVRLHLLLSRGETR